MAKEYKFAVQVCIVLSIVAVIGIVIGIKLNNPIVIIACLLPTSIYEAYRTEGFFTKLTSLALLGILIAELVLLAGKINITLLKFLEKTDSAVKKYIPMGDIKLIAPVVIALLALMLLRRTFGLYTRWLAIIIFLTSIALVYVLNPLIINEVTGLFGK
ncbi:hypothetical protein ACFL20_04670 [Spirochaetota bacterium]